VIRFSRGWNCQWLPPTAALPEAASLPAILFLHGIGERGEGGADLPRVAAWGLPKLRLQNAPALPAPFPFLLIAPQCPPDRTWCDTEVLDALSLLLEAAISKGDVDPAALVIAGFSMGGVGAYCAALRWPDRFAALVSVCGACLEAERLEALSRLPQWVAWAEDDEVAYLAEGSREIVARLAGSAPVVARPYAIGPYGDDSAHTRTADAAFSEPELYRWLCNTIR
jgi:predicted peptidase